MVDGLNSVGNSEQMERIANGIAEGILRRIREDDEAARTLAAHQHPEFQAWVDKRIGEKIRLWFLGILISNVIPLIAIAFYLGGINSDMQQARREQDINTAALYSRGGFVRDQTSFNCRVRDWIDQNFQIDLGPCKFESADDPQDRRR